MTEKLQYKGVEIEFIDFDKPSDKVCFANVDKIQNELTVDNSYDIETAIRIAELWEVGKMIGGDENAVIAALLDEVRRLRSEVIYQSDNR